MKVIRQWWMGPTITPIEALDSFGRAIASQMSRAAKVYGHVPAMTGARSQDFHVAHDKAYAYANEDRLGWSPYKRGLWHELTPAQRNEAFARAIWSKWNEGRSDAAQAG